MTTAPSADGSPRSATGSNPIGSERAALLRLAIALAGPILTAGVTDVGWWMALLGGSVAVTLIARPEPRMLAVRLASLTAFLVPVLPLVALAGRSENRLAMALVLGMRGFAAVLWITAWTNRINSRALARGLTRIGVPAALLDVAWLTERYRHVLGAEFGRLTRAMTLRGYRPELSRRSLLDTGNAAAILLVRGVDRAERVRAAMLCRGHGATSELTGSSEHLAAPVEARVAEVEPVRTPPDSVAVRA